MKQARWIAAILVIIAAVAVVHSQTTIIQRPRTNTGLSVGIGYGTTTPTASNSDSGPIDGEIFSVLDTGDADPITYQYSDFSSAWNEVLMQSSGGDVTIDDELNLTGALNVSTLREDFDGPINMFCTQNDSTACSVTDAEVNLLLIQGAGNLGVISYRLEAPGGPGLAATPDPLATPGVFTVDGFVDDADNEGIVFTFGADNQASGHGFTFSETSSPSMYCEMQIDVANISAVDDAWFGWVTNDATDNPPASADYDTAALFTVVDATGDINITTMLNNGSEASDDTGVDWTDGDEFILRVTIAADSVSFSGALTNGSTTLSSITQTNATLNADDGDEFKCVFGFTNSANESYGVTIDYVEIGPAGQSVGS